MELGRSLAPIRANSRSGGDRPGGETGIAGCPTGNTAIRSVLDATRQRAPRTRRCSMKTAILIILMIVFVRPAIVAAQNGPVANIRPSILDKVGIDQKLGAVVPAELVFNDEHGQAVRLGDFFGNRPIVLVLVYYQCPMLCTMVLNDLLRTMRSMPENVGKDFDVLTVSFDPRDTPDLALLKKKTYLAQYNRPDSGL